MKTPFHMRSLESEAKYLTHSLAAKGATSTCEAKAAPLTGMLAASERGEVRETGALCSRKWPEPPLGWRIASPHQQEGGGGREDPGADGRAQRSRLQPGSPGGHPPRDQHLCTGPRTLCLSPVRNTHRACERGCNPTPTSSCGGQGRGVAPGMGG